jgi:hypothetical protein
MASREQKDVVVGRRRDVVVSREKGVFVMFRAAHSFRSGRGAPFASLYRFERRSSADFKLQK